MKITKKKWKQTSGKHMQGGLDHKMSPMVIPYPRAMRRMGRGKWGDWKNSLRDHRP